MYYISRNYKSLFNAAGKAKTDCEISLQNLGFNCYFPVFYDPQNADQSQFLGITLNY